MAKEIDARKKKIVCAVVQGFILSGKPVGSKSAARASGLRISPATVRNEMAVLEKMGLLEQPHTSAGRVPTDLAYRLYVDMLMDQRKPSGKDTEAVEKLFAAKTREMEGFFREASLILSNLTNGTAMVFAPFRTADRIRYIDLIPINGWRVAVIIITKRGEAGRRIFSLSGPVKADTVERICGYLNKSLIDVELDVVDTESLIESSGFGNAGLELLRNALETIYDYLGTVEERVYVGGTANIVREMNYAGIEWVQLLLEAMEKQYFILDLLKELVGEERLTVRIGGENRIDELRKCAFVGASYPAGQGLSGSLGVLGPTCMDYARTIGMVELMADSLGRRVFSQQDQKEQ